MMKTKVQDDLVSAVDLTLMKLGKLEHDGHQPRAEQRHLISCRHGPSDKFEC